MTSPSATRLPTSTIWTYALIGLPLAMIGYPVGIYLPDLYSGERGVSLAAIGTMLMLARTTDAITDPLMGFASDRTRSRFGRRKPWIAAGVPVMLVGIVMLFMPPEGVSQWYLLTWYVVMTLGSTLITLPYRAWGAELSSDYHTRTRIMSAGEVLILIGLIVAAAVPFLARFVSPEGVDSSVVLRALALVLLVVLPGCAALVLPTALFLVALYLAWTYPLTAERHARLEAAIQRRDARLRAAQP